jgi:hypothetical protein
MAQLGHPYGDKVKASQRRRLKALGAHAGKPFGSAAMQQKRSYPKKNAGTEREMTISGKTAGARADRLASGGSVRRHKPQHTTNIIISHAGGQGGRGGVGAGGVGAAPGGGAMRPPMPPMRPPLGAGAPPMGAPPAMPPRPMMPMGGGMPMGGALPPRPPIAPPGGGMPMRPPGMKRGGSVKKKRAGGPLSPTTDAEQRDQHSEGHTVSTPDRKRSGGAIRKLQMGGAPMASQTNPIAGLAGGLAGGAGTRPTPTQPGVRTISGVPARPATPLAVPMPNTLAAQRFMPAPGTTTGFKKGGKVHGDEAEDKKLFARMYKEKEAKEEGAPSKRKRGGHVGEGLAGPKYHDHGVGRRKDGGGITGLPGEVYRNEGRGETSGRAVANPWGISNPPGAVRKRAAGGFVPSNQDSKDPGLHGDKYHQQGVGFRKMGGDVGESKGMGPHMPGSAAGGLGRLEKAKMARSVPAKTES